MRRWRHRATSSLGDQHLMSSFCFTIRICRRFVSSLALVLSARRLRMAHEHFSTALKMPDIDARTEATRPQDLLAAADKKLFPGSIQRLRAKRPALSDQCCRWPLARRRFWHRVYCSITGLPRVPTGNWFGAFGLNYVHDFENQHGDTFEATALGYDAQQFTLHQFDIGLSGSSVPDRALASRPQARSACRSSLTWWPWAARWRTRLTTVPSAAA